MREQAKRSTGAYPGAYAGASDDQTQPTVCTTPIQWECNGTSQVIIRVHHLVDVRLEDLITEHEAAELLGVAYVTMRRWRRLGHGPPWFRIGPRLIKYERDSVLRFAQAGN